MLLHIKEKETVNDFWSNLVKNISKVFNPPFSVMFCPGLVAPHSAGLCHRNNKLGAGRREHSLNIRLVLQRDGVPGRSST